jgi:hypothetical protein
MAERSVRRRARFIYLSDATARDLAEPTPTYRVAWRVIAANNRPLGRSARTYESYAACRAAVVELQEQIDGLLPSVLFDGAHGHWTWRLDDARGANAVCVHPYLRRVECSRALSQFVLAVSDCEPSLEPLRHFGAHALNAYDVVRAR